MKSCQFYNDGTAELRLSHAEMERLVVVLHQHRATLNHTANDPKTSEAHALVLKDDEAFCKSITETVMRSRKDAQRPTAPESTHAGLPLTRNG